MKNPKQLQLTKMAHIDIVQQVALCSVADALDDAGFDPKFRDKSRVAVILEIRGRRSADDTMIRSRLPKSFKTYALKNIFSSFLSKNRRN